MTGHWYTVVRQTSSIISPFGSVSYRLTSESCQGSAGTCNNDNAYSFTFVYVYSIICKSLQYIKNDTKRFRERKDLGLALSFSLFRIPKFITSSILCGVTRIIWDVRTRTIDISTMAVIWDAIFYAVYIKGMHPPY